MSGLFVSSLYHYLFVAILSLYETSGVSSITYRNTTAATIRLNVFVRPMKIEINKLSLLSLIINSIIIIFNHCELATFQ